MDGRGTILASEVDIYISMKTDHCFSKELQVFAAARGAGGRSARPRRPRIESESYRGQLGDPVAPWHPILFLSLSCQSRTPVP